MNQNLLSNLWADFSTEMGVPALRWQILALIVCFVLGWALARFARSVIAAREEKVSPMRRLGLESFTRVLWPLLTLLLLVIAKPMLLRWGGGVDLVRIAIPLVGSFALIRVLSYVMQRAFAHGGRLGGFVLLTGKGFASLIWLVVAMHITGLLPDLVELLENTSIPLGRNKISILMVVQGALSIGITLMIALWASAMLEVRLMGINSIHSSMRVVLSRMGRALLILIGLLLSLSMVGIDLTVLSVFGGALGVGLGLGLQKIASSYVSGFIILLERSLTIGDTVTLDKFSGRVSQINTRYTVLRGGDGTDTVVPNEMFVSNAVQNFSLTDSIVQVSTRITVDYRTDIDLALRLLQEAALCVERVRKGPDRTPGATLVAFGVDGIDLQLGFWVNDPEGRGGVLSDVNRAIWRSFQEHKINVPFPGREIRLIDEQYSVIKERLNSSQRPAEPDSHP